MSVSPSDVLAPHGEIEAFMLPQDANAAVLNTRLSGYIGEGVEEVAKHSDVDDADGAVRAWAHYRAWEAIAARLAMQPTTVSVEGEGMRSYSGVTPGYATGRAAAWLSLFQRKVGVGVAEAPQPGPTAFAQTIVVP